MRLVMENCMLPVSRTLLILSAFLFVRSQSQVPDDVVIMDTNPVLLLGRQGDLQCRFNQAPIAVYWLKGETFESAEDLITLHTGGITTPLDKNKGLFDINDEYSLVIFNVTDDTTGTYYCRVSDYRGYIIRSHTSVTVRTPPNDPYPAIDGCFTGAPCAIELPNGNAADITCRTEDASVGLVSLAWKGACPFEDQATEKWTNPNGLTENVTVTVSAVPCNEPYTCVADLAATRIDQTTASILVSGPPKVQSTTISLTAATTAANRTNVNPVLSGGKIAAVVLLLLALGLLVIALICYLRKAGRCQNFYSAVDTENRHHEKIVSTENTRLSTSDLHEFALQISGRHCSKLGKAANLTEEEIRQRNEENIKHIYNVTDMLRHWLQTHKCSNDAYRHKLEEIAKKSGRTDIKGVFIKSEEFVRHTESANVPQENETQSRDSLSSKSEMVNDVTQEEIDRVHRFAGDAVIKKLGSVLGQDVSLGGSSNSLLEARGKERARRLRKKISEILKSENVGWLMPTFKEIKVCLVEIVDLAWRILLDDVHDFAQALTGSSDDPATYMMKFGSDSAGKGTIAIMKRLYEQEDVDKNRLDLCKILKKNGYFDVAKLLAFGCHLVGYGDILAVAQAEVNCQKLFDMLKDGVPEFSCLAGFASKGRIVSFLCSWKTRIPRSGYNHRTALADALHSLDHTALGLEVLSGKHRTQQSDVIQEELLKLLDNERKHDSTPPGNMKQLASTIGNIQGTISEFNKESIAATIKHGVMTVVDTVLSNQKEFKAAELSDELCRAGHYELAVDIMLGLKPTPTREVKGGGKQTRGSTGEGNTYINYEKSRKRNGGNVKKETGGNIARGEEKPSNENLAPQNGSAATETTDTHGDPTGPDDGKAHDERDVFLVIEPEDVKELDVAFSS